VLGTEIQTRGDFILRDLKTGAIRSSVSLYEGCDSLFSIALAYLDSKLKWQYSSRGERNPVNPMLSPG
jgi:hypothetical protein